MGRALQAADADVGVFWSPNMEIVNLNEPDRVSEKWLR